MEWVEILNKHFYSENIDLKEMLLVVRSSSMRDNLYFTNTPEIDEYESPEEIENMVIKICQ